MRKHENDHSQQFYIYYISTEYFPEVKSQLNQPQRGRLQNFNEVNEQISHNSDSCTGIAN